MFEDRVEDVEVGADVNPVWMTPVHVLGRLPSTVTVCSFFVVKNY